MRDIHIMSVEEINEFWFLLERFGFVYERAHYERCIERHLKGTLTIILSRLENEYCGFCILNRDPKYALFRTLGIPEVQDLNVLPAYRRSGLGRALILFCEVLAKECEYDEIGIGVGLNASFGAAQRLYVRLGYIPDGTGVSYDRKQIFAGEMRPVDDNLCLMMIKNLSETP